MWLLCGSAGGLCMLCRSVHKCVTHSRRAFSAPRRCFGFFRASHRRLWVLGGTVGTAVVLTVKSSLWASGTCDTCECDTSVACESGGGARYERAIKAGRELLRRIKDEVGAPGLVVGVCVDGVQVWSEGLGFADLENRVPCTADTVMRIASISKPLTATAVARLWEQGLIDLDAPVQKYVPEFPEKQFEGENVTITTRMLLSHMSGIRHYEKDAAKVREEKEKANQKYKPEKEKKPAKSQEAQRKEEFEQEEYYLKQHFGSVLQALDLFKNDPLIFRPGTTSLYSTHAFTLLSAVVEKVSGQRFLDHMMQMFRELGMLSTVPDENDPIIYHRSRNYHFSKKGRIVNCPYVDNSYKWAGGGFLSTVEDLLLFGNAMLYSYQAARGEARANLLPGLLRPQTALLMWRPADRTPLSWHRDGLYALGWVVVEKRQRYGQCRSRRHYISHTGGAVGASSVLLVLPTEGQAGTPPKGVVVTVLSNMQSVGLSKTAFNIALEFEKARDRTI